MQGYLLSVSRLYEDLEYEQALGQIARARRLPLSVEENTALSLYEGIILAEMSHWEESAAAFKAALSQDPAAKLPVRVSPKVEQHLEAVRQEVQRELANTRPAGETSAPQLAQQDPARPPAGTPPPEAVSPHGEEKSLSEAPALTPLDAKTVPATTTEASSSGLLRSQVLIPAISGGVLLVAGGTSWALSRRELSRLRNNDPSLATREDARSSASRGRTYQTVGVGLLGVGLVGLGVATGLYVLGVPSNEGMLGMSTDGTSAFVQGRWP